MAPPDSETDRLAGELGRLIAETPGLGDLLSRVLDRREGTGSMPSRVTMPASPECIAALRSLLSARAVTSVAGGRVRLDLVRADGLVRDQGGDGFDGLLYLTLGRARRDPAAEETALRQGLAVELARLVPKARSAAAAAWLGAERGALEDGRGELLAVAHGEGAGRAAEEAAELVTCIDAVLANAATIRLPNFAARVLGRSKALQPGSDRLRRLCEALYDHDPATRSYVHFDYPGEPTSIREAHFRALEVHGVTRDEGALSVLCYGPLVYSKQGQRFDQVARHAALGDVCRLTLQQLRGAELAELPIERITVLENHTPFLDRVETLVNRPELPRELVIASEGQAGWAVVTLLRLVAAARLGVAARHAGDLDRSGVLILRSLQRRSGIRLEPLAMDVATHRRFAAHGRALAVEERERLRALLSDDATDQPCHELLVEIERTGLWIEQEVFSGEVLLPGRA